MPAFAWGKAIGVAVSLAAVVGLAVLLRTLSERDSRLPRLALTLEDERARARAAKLPQSMADLAKRPPVSDSENAATYYREAVALAPDWTPEERQAIRRILDPQAAPEPKDKSRLESLLRRTAPAIVQLIRGSQLPHSDFGWRGTLSEKDWAERRAVLLGCDRLTQLLQVYAFGRRKDAEHALFILSALERITRHLTEEEGLLVWQNRTYQIFLSARLLTLITRTNPERAAEVKRVLETWHIPKGSLKKTWKLQCIKELEDSQRARQKPYKPDTAPLLDYNPLWRELDRVDHQLGWKLYADASEVIHLRYWRTVQEALAPLPDDDLVGQWKALKAVDEAEDARGKTVPGYWYPQRFGGVASQLLIAEVTLQLARVELALQDYERKTGTRPKSLEALAGAAPIKDPFSEGILIWKDSLLYSVGPDGVDDGGLRSKDVLWNLETVTAPQELRSRRSATRRPGHVAGRAE